MQRSETDYDGKSGLRWLFLSLLLLLLLNLAIGYTPVPLSILPLVNILITVIFVTVPIVGLYLGANHPWNPKLATGFIITGVIMQVGFVLLGRMIFGVGFMAALSFALAQTGLVLWTIGLGALLTTMLKDKNLLIPVSIFLAAFDIFLVLTPSGVTGKILRAAPEVLPTVAYTVPRAQSQPVYGMTAPAAYIGPADFVFMAMFFIALYRFSMRTRETAIALIPTLFIYLLLTYTVGPLPALVPIGICVLAMNLKEFKLNKEEWSATALVAAVAIGLIIFGATRPKPKPEPAGAPSYPGAMESPDAPSRGVPGIPQG